MCLLQVYGIFLISPDFKQFAAKLKKKSSFKYLIITYKLPFLLSKETVSINYSFPQKKTKISTISSEQLIRSYKFEELKYSLMTIQRLKYA